MARTEREQVDAVVRLVRTILADAVIGAYLHGSAATSSLRAESDLDILVVAQRRTTEDERRALIEGFLGASRTPADPSGKRNLEVTFVVRPDIQPWRYPPPMELQYGDWLRSELEAGHSPWKTPNADLAIVLTAARARNVALFGPPLDSLIDPVPRGDLDHALRDVIPDLLADLETDVRNVLLTLARVWFTLATGTIAPKDVAADWVLERLPAERGTALRRARAAYRGEIVDLWDDDAMVEARADAGAIRAEIEARR